MTKINGSGRKVVPIRKRKISTNYKNRISKLKLHKLVIGVKPYFYPPNTTVLDMLRSLQNKSTSNFPERSLDNNKLPK